MFNPTHIYKGPIAEREVEILSQDKWLATIRFRCGAYWEGDDIFATKVVRPDTLRAI